MMRSFVVLAISMVLTLPAAADPKPTRLTMQFIEGTNLHMANQRGAINWSADIKLTVDLLAAGRLEAVATGWKKEHNLDVRPSGTSWNTDDETKLTLKWTGAWSETPGKMTLDLSLVSESCTHTQTTNRGAPETLECRHASKAAKLECTSISVDLEDLAKPGKKLATPAWACAPKDFDDLGESPGWLLGKATCIKTFGRSMGSGSRFERC
jgi:hypothetical protein